MENVLVASIIPLGLCNAPATPEKQEIAGALLTAQLSGSPPLSSFRF